MSIVLFNTQKLENKQPNTAAAIYYDAILLSQAGRKQLKYMHMHMLVDHFVKFVVGDGSY